MKKEIYRVGVYIEDEFNEFATCTTVQSAKRAKKLLEDAGWGDDCEDCDYYDECEYCKGCTNPVEDYPIEDETEPCCGVVILKSNLYLDTITIDDVEYDLAESEE